MNAFSTRQSEDYKRLDEIAKTGNNKAQCLLSDTEEEVSQKKGYLRDNEYLMMEDEVVTITNVFNRSLLRKSTSLPKPSWGKLKIWVSLTAALLLFFGIYYGNFMSEDNRPAEKALALLTFAALLWATEAVPLWVTAMTIPFIIILFNLQIKDRNDKTVILTDKGTLAKDILSGLISSNVVLIFGGFTLARALQKYKLDRKLAIAVLSRITNFKIFLFVLMLMGSFLSMWMSNVVAPALIVLVVEPAMKNAELQTGRCIAIAIAFSNNIGGMLTPIASPQNDIAVENLSTINDVDVDFGTWMAVATPLCILHLTCVWMMLLWYYDPKGNMHLLAVEDSKLDRRHWYIIFVLIITVLMWCFYKLFADLWGCLGTIGLIPVIALYSTGVLDKKDLSKTNWAILLLLGGGEILGRAIEDSSLLDLLANQITKKLDGKSPWFYAMVFNIVVMLPTNFISHTVGAITMLPVIGTVALEIGQAGPLIIGGVLCCSGSCALPVSSFPNVISYSLCDGTGRKFLRVRDYVTLGIPTQIFVYSATTTLGWIIMQQLNFD